MKTDVRLSTRFLTTQNAHQVGMLVTLEGETPVRRPPINVALVLDRSGSMSGMPLEAAKDAAARFAVFPHRRTGWRWSRSTTRSRPSSAPRPPATLGRGGGDRPSRSRAARPTSPAAGSRARKLVEQGMVEGTNRVVLLTDGQANVGIVEPEQAGRPRRARGRAAGQHHLHRLRPRLQRGPARADGPRRAAATTGTSSPRTRWRRSSRARSRAWSPSPRRTSRSRCGSPTRGWPASASSSPIRSSHADGGWRVALHDLYATSPRALGLVFHVEDVRELGKVTLGEVRIEADVVTRGRHRAPDHRHAGPRQPRRRGPGRAYGRADVSPVPGGAGAGGGGPPGGRGRLRPARPRASWRPSPSMEAAPTGAGLEEEMEDLRAEAARLEERRFDATDRKYHHARAMAARDMKAGVCPAGPSATEGELTDAKALCSRHWWRWR